ncbi:MAG TPA: VOC family protein [Acidimicrobiales bacterium]|nr:VOC family protein [Acidimicrobiales bacterium]
MLDCTDLARAAAFWTAALGYETVGAPHGPYQVLLAGERNGVELLLQRVPDAKVAKNRLHLDLRTKDLAGEVERIRGLGATQMTLEPIVEGGWSWHVLADPDGNELCILEPPARYWQGAIG